MTDPLADLQIAEEERLFREQALNDQTWHLLRDAYEAVALIAQRGYTDTTDPLAHATLIDAEAGEALLRSKAEVVKVMRRAQARGITPPGWALRAIEEDTAGL